MTFNQNKTLSSSPSVLCNLIIFSQIMKERKAMQLIHDFNISPEEYDARGKKNDFPRLDVCPCCSYPSNLSRHGFYWRNAIFCKAQFRIPILRLKCSSCGKTILFLPDFLLPYFQYSLKNISWKLWQTDTWNGPYLNDGGKKKPTYLIVSVTLNL